MLCKAAYFHKPIVVSDRYLMGNRVRKYSIGICVQEDCATSMLEGLDTISAKQLPEENFASFCSAFGAEALAEHLKNYLSRSLA